MSLPIRKQISGILGVHIGEGELDAIWKQCDEMGRIKSNIQPMLLALIKKIDEIENKLIEPQHD